MTPPTTEPTAAEAVSLPSHTAKPAPDPCQAGTGPGYADAKVKQPIEPCHSDDPKSSMTENSDLNMRIGR
jgi:hypothetical protein